MRNHQQLGHSVYTVAEEFLQSCNNSVENLPAATKRPNVMPRAKSAAILTPVPAAEHLAGPTVSAAKEGELRLSKSESQLKGVQLRDSGLGSSTRSSTNISQDTGKRAHVGSKRSSTVSSNYSQPQRAELVKPCVQGGGDDQGIEMIEMAPAAVVA